MTLALILALSVPIMWAIMNVLDKYIVSHRVKHTLSFAFIAAMTNVFFGMLIAIFVPWSEIGAKDLFWPTLVGVMYGVQFYLYYVIMEQEDPSNVIGLAYVYPLIVAMLSYLFIDEIISGLGYLGMVLIVIGAILLSLRLQSLGTKAKIWMIIGIVITVALGEFFTKIATTQLPEWNAIAITNMVAGLCFLPALFFANIRKGIPHEMHNAPWTLITEALTLAGIASLFIAMSELPATFVASVGATQPLLVLLFERLAESRYGKISRDHLLKPKLVAISLIVLGVILLYVAELL